MFKEDIYLINKHHLTALKVPIKLALAASFILLSFIQLFI